MAYEILNHANVTPHRLHALVRLVSRLQSPNREDVINLLQPEVLPSLKKQDSAKEVYTAARTCGLIEDLPGSGVKLSVHRDAVEEVNTFRRHMQTIVYGVIEENADNYLFNLYTAWYAVQGERVLQLERKQFETRFNDEVYPTAESRQFNDTKLNGWRSWAAFLGSGWTMRYGTGEVLMPDAYQRLLPLLTQLLPDSERTVSFSDFATALAEQCPELDGGMLFEQCWQVSRGAEQRGNRLSLMLSTALRALDETREIELILQADAMSRWHLFPAAGHPIAQVSHICRRSH